jgi:hypothetical protein
MAHVQDERPERDCRRLRDPFNTDAEVEWVLAAARGHHQRSVLSELCLPIRAPHQGVDAQICHFADTVCFVSPPLASEKNCGASRRSNMP